MRIVTIVGARPQFIKAAAVSRAVAADDDLQETLVHTGQHYDDNMSQVFFDELEIRPPDHSLGVGSGSHGEQTAKMLAAIERILLDERPDWTLVYGDTNSTLAGAVAAAKLCIPIAHVEAGVRSFNRRMPEEVNRVLTDHAADLLLAPTEAAVANLRREGVPDRSIHLVGDVMYDVALFSAARADAQSKILETLGVEPKQYILATAHRAENTDDPARLAAVFGGLAETARRLPVVLPLHPRTRAALERNGMLAGATAALQLVEPLGYLDMTALERGAALVATDSGGVQKEAYFHDVACVTLRDETEWVELVELGWNRLAPPTDAGSVAAAIDAALDRVNAMPPKAELYGGGQAAGRIVERLVAARPATKQAAAAAV